VLIHSRVRLFAFCTEGPIHAAEGLFQGINSMKPHHPARHRTEHIGWLRAAVLGANDGIVSTKLNGLDFSKGSGPRKLQLEVYPDIASDQTKNVNAAALFKLLRRWSKQLSRSCPVLFHIQMPCQSGSSYFGVEGRATSYGTACYSRTETVAVGQAGR
jgi:hypothetical protein